MKFPADMKIHVLLIFLLLLIFSCKQQQETTPGAGEDQTETPADKDREPTGDSISYISYKNEGPGIKLEHPESFGTYEDMLPGDAPVVNVYDKQNEKEPPYAIHEDASLTYMAFLPEGYGVDAPAGKRKSFAEWEGRLPLNFPVDRQESFAYLLESGAPWAYIIRFHSAPEGWKEYGNIFIRLKVRDLKTECVDGETGELKPMKDCRALGEDQIKRYGEVDRKAKSEINRILRSLYFFKPGTEITELSDFIKVEQPSPNEKIGSPLLIKGKARGNWFFEADAPVKLLDDQYHILASGYISAQGEWMTTDFVPFEGRLEFTVPAGERGYLVLEKANPSAKPEHSRSLYIPVKF